MTHPRRPARHRSGKHVRRLLETYVVASAGLALVALGACSPAAGGQADADGSPTPSASTTPPREPSGPIPDAAMLQPADVGSGYRTGEPRGDWDLGDAMAIACRGARLSDVAPTHERDQLLSKNGPGIAQRVSRYPSKKGSQYLTDVTSAVENCQTTPGSSTFEVVNEGFAGEESIMVTATRGDGNTTVYGFVRQGDVVSQIRFESSDHDTATRIADKAADRMCRTTPAC